MSPDIPQLNFGDLVYHKTEDTPGIVVGFLYRPGGGMLYQVTWQGRSSSDHYACELTTERPFFTAHSEETD